MDSQPNRQRAILHFWRALLVPHLCECPTPFYLFSVAPLRTALKQLDKFFGHLPVRHWLSFKTQPLRPLLQWWRARGRPVEVVSEFEFLAALREGFAPGKILVNGPAKHYWLARQATVRGLLVNFDSPAETRTLAPLAKKLGWRCGLRLLTSEEFDPETPKFPTQFGMTAVEAADASAILRQKGVRIETVHFHLRTNVTSPASYERALAEAARTCRAIGLAPEQVDCGGGFPPPMVRTPDGRRVDEQFDCRALAGVYQRAVKLFPSARELWLENGRWLTARTGVLVVKILEVKERRGMRHLICDGGRTLHALVANWEAHGLMSLPGRGGPTTLTTVTGPTCMAFDQLARRPLPRSLRPGDHLVWLDAGAYHLPWETRFSHGLATVLWHDGNRVRVVRPRESFAQWWAQWV